MADTHKGPRWVIEGTDGKLILATVRDNRLLWVFKTKMRAESELGARAGQAGKAVELSDAQFSEVLDRCFAGGVLGYCYAEDEGTVTYPKKTVDKPLPTL